jgi:tetratricopeptide (TPR) repeat protein
VAEKTESPKSGAAGGGESADPAAIALALSGASREDADVFLKKQGRLTDLQIGDLEREDQVRHWSLRVHHISDMMKLSFEFAAAFILLAAATFLGVALWTAAHDKSLIVDAFDVPPDLAARGLSGKVMASRIEDRLSWMQAHTITSRPASTYRHDWGDDIKVQIPDTGVSIGELYHYLVGWLGDQTHITGEIWRTQNGIALTTRAGSNPGPVLTGADSDLDSLIVKAAEQIYRQTQPYRYIAFLDRQGRIPEELIAARELALDGPPLEKPWAYTRWGVTLESLGDLRGALQKQQMATVFGPTLPHAWYNLGAAEAPLGYDEAALQDNLKALSLLQSRAAAQLASYAVAVDIPILKMLTAEATGDYRTAIAQVPQIEAIENYGDSHQSAEIMLSADLASDHDISASQKSDHGAITAESASLQLGAGGSFDLQPLPTFMRAATLEDWRTARDDLIEQDRSKAAQDPAMRPMLPVLTWPRLAYAQAELSDFAAARALIDRTPLDCDLCLRMRGDIDAAQKNPNGAGYWFARAVSQAPSIPFAYTDWGGMLMEKGDFDAAIAKFQIANKKGPRFADPLEMWGEALMQKNRSDLALAKFEEADKYAPNWGRLHIKWGEALWWSGRRDEARKQFAIASGFDLSPAEKFELANEEAHLG